MKKLLLEEVFAECHHVMCWFYFLSLNLGEFQSVPGLLEV